MGGGKGRREDGGGGGGGNWEVSAKVKGKCSFLIYECQVFRASNSKLSLLFFFILFHTVFILFSSFLQISILKKEKYTRK